MHSVEGGGEIPHHKTYNLKIWRIGKRSWSWGCSLLLTINRLKSLTKLHATAMNYRPILSFTMFCSSLSHCSGWYSFIYFYKPKSNEHLKFNTNVPHFYKLVMGILSPISEPDHLDQISNKRWLLWLPNGSSFSPHLTCVIRLNLAVF